MIVQSKTSKRHKSTVFTGFCAFFSFAVIGVWLVPVWYLTAQDQELEKQSFIALRTKETLYGKVELKSPPFGQEYLLFEDTVRYPLSKIRAFQNEEGYFALTHIGGLYGEPKLIKRTQSGKISLYTAYQMYSSPGSFNTISTPGGRITQYTPGITSFARFDYFSTSDTSDILPATRDNLMAALSSNPKSIQLLREHKTLGNAKIVLILGGLGLIGSAFVGADKDHPPSLGLLVAGGVVANLSWIPGMMQSGKMEKAIEVYNRN